MNIGALLNPAAISAAASQSNLPIQQTPAPAPVQQPSGLFGIKGTARDILGTLGDAFLVQSGNRPVYAGVKRQERVAEASRDFVSDPLGTVRRLNDLGETDLARQAYSEYEQSQARQADQQRKAQEQVQRSAKTALETERIEAQIVNERSKQYEVIGKVVSAANETTWPAIRANIITSAERAGLTIPNPPEQFDPNYVDSIKKFAIDPYQQERLEDYDKAEERQQTESANRNKNRNAQTSISAGRAATAASSVANSNRNRDARTEIARTNSQAPKSGERVVRTGTDAQGRRIQEVRNTRTGAKRIVVVE